MDKDKQNNKENINPRGNLGALFLKIGKKSDYYLMKLSVDGKNMTFVCFPNPAKDMNNEDDLYSKSPAYYIFPYKPKDRINGNSK